MIVKLLCWILQPSLHIKSDLKVWLPGTLSGLCESFSSFFQAPFRLEVFSTALAVMDIHAHISRTEVIGMLGGQFDKPSSCLTISMAVPCKSISTGMQCEMDPGELLSGRAVSLWYCRCSHQSVITRGGRPKWSWMKTPVVMYLIRNCTAVTSMHETETDHFE